MPDQVWAVAFIVAFIVVLLAVAWYTDHRVKRARRGLTRPATAGADRHSGIPGVERTAPGAATHMHTPGP